jgi:3-oxoacyl-(acyl-carrier-protein) synthase
MIHPTANLEDPEPVLECIDVVRGTPRSLEVEVALSNSFGFGGHNSTIIFAPYRP